MKFYKRFHSFCRSFSHLFTHKTHFLGQCFFKIFKCLISRLSYAYYCKPFLKTAWQSTEIFYGALGRLAEFLGFLRLCSNFCDKVCLNLWIATLALLARNDGQRKRTSPFRNDGGFVILSVAKNPHHCCHFEPFIKRRKIHRI